MCCLLDTSLLLVNVGAPLESRWSSPDGTLIGAISADGFAKVWDRKASTDAALLPKRPNGVAPAEK